MKKIVKAFQSVEFCQVAVLIQIKENCHFVLISLDFNIKNF